MRSKTTQICVDGNLSKSASNNTLALLLFTRTGTSQQKTSLKYIGDCSSPGNSTGGSFDIDRLRLHKSYSTVTPGTTVSAATEAPLATKAFLPTHASASADCDDAE